jgi:hypothetical protein
MPGANPTTFECTATIVVGIVVVECTLQNIEAYYNPGIGLTT